MVFASIAICKHSTAVHHFGNDLYVFFRPQGSIKPKINTVLYSQIDAYSM